MVRCVPRQWFLASLPLSVGFTDLSSYVTEDLYTISYPCVPEPKGLEITNGQLVTEGIEPMDTFTV